MTRTAKGRSLSFTDADWTAIKADAAREGLPVAAYLRSLWLAARPREVTAGAWASCGASDVRVGRAWAIVDRTGWEADDGSGVRRTGADGDLSANRAAADAWLRSRGVVLA